jgi:hypothetical protein
MNTLPKKMSYRNGDFSFIEHNLYRQIIEHDYRVIDENHLWEYLKHHNSWDNNNNYLAKYTWASGYLSFNFHLVMDDLRRIAINGWKNFVDRYKSA